MGIINESKFILCFATEIKIVTLKIRTGVTIIINTTPYFLLIKNTVKNAHSTSFFIV